MKPIIIFLSMSSVFLFPCAEGYLQVDTGYVHDYLLHRLYDRHGPAYRSWQKMLEAGAQTIYPSHGQPFPAEKLRRNMGWIQTTALTNFF